jgi:hypothetical protein
MGVQTWRVWAGELCCRRIPARRGHPRKVSAAMDALSCPRCRGAERAFARRPESPRYARGGHADGGNAALRDGRADNMQWGLTCAQRAMGKRSVPARGQRNAQAIRGGSSAERRAQSPSRQRRRRVLRAVRAQRDRTRRRRRRGADFLTSDLHLLRQTQRFPARVYPKCIDPPLRAHTWNIASSMRVTHLAEPSIHLLRAASERRPHRPHCRAADAHVRTSSARNHLRYE